MQDPTKPIWRVYNECIIIGSDSEEDLDAIPECFLDNVIISQAQEQLIPQQVRDVTIRGQWKRTWKGETFLVHQGTH